MSFQTLFDFESALARYTGAPYVVVTDCCTHAIELCFRWDMVRNCKFTAYTYLSVPQLMRQLGVNYELTTEYWNSQGEYQFHGTRIWDSARLLKPNMYRAGQLQCLSFGHNKPLSIGRAGAILLDNEQEYLALSKMRSDGRDLHIEPWEHQDSFEEGYHYCPTLEICALGIEKLSKVDPEPKYHQYPDLRTIDFIR
jgi:dTDP-4-amino-4,6-dideoxygalactose transaminase